MHERAVCGKTLEDKKYLTHNKKHENTCKRRKNGILNYLCTIVGKFAKNFNVVDSERFHLNVFSAMFPRESAWRKLDRVTQKRGESLLALIRTYVVKTFQISPFS